MSRYFCKKDYIMLYLDNFFSYFANSIYGAFTPVILYKAGVSITAIIFIYAVQFLVMGIFTPLSGIIVKSKGVAVAKGISYILKTISLLLVLTAKVDITYYLLISVMYGLSGAIHNPLNTYVPSKIVEEDFRGRFNAFKYIFRCISSVVGYIFVTIFLIKDNNTVIVTTVFIPYLLATIAVANLDKSKFNYGFEKTFKESYKYLFKKNENVKLKEVSGLRSFIIIERLIAIPLYLYISFNDIKTFAMLYIISTIVEMLSLFISGNKLDKNANKTFSIISTIKWIMSGVFVIFKNKYILTLNQSLYKLIDNVYESAYGSVSQSKVECDKTDTFILSMVHEMSLCFFEFIILSILAVISIYNGMFALKITFICSIIAIIINNKIIKNWKNNEI